MQVCYKILQVCYQTIIQKMLQMCEINWHTIFIVTVRLSSSGKKYIYKLIIIGIIDVFVVFIMYENVSMYHYRLWYVTTIRFVSFWIHVSVFLLLPRCQVIRKVHRYLLIGQPYIRYKFIYLVMNILVMNNFP